MGFPTLLAESRERHEVAFGDRECDARTLRNPGFLHWRAGGEKHVNDPSSISLLQVPALAKETSPIPLGSHQIREQVGV